MTASQSSYFRKSELSPLLINNYIIAGAWPDDQRKIPRVVGSKPPRLHHLHAGCMCRSSAEHRLKIEGLGAQTQTILLACREHLEGEVCVCVCVRERRTATWGVTE